MDECKYQLDEDETDCDEEYEIETDYDEEYEIYPKLDPAMMERIRKYQLDECLMDSLYGYEYEYGHESVDF